MSWFGKIMGGSVGFMLGGPIGALIGVSLGHALIDDKTRAISVENWPFYRSGDTSGGFLYSCLCHAR